MILQLFLRNEISDLDKIFSETYLVLSEREPYISRFY